MGTTGLRIEPLGASSLAPREVQVLQRAAEGDTVRDTADMLGTSYWTVQTQRQIILEKLGVGTIAHAVAEGMRAGVIE